MLTLHILRAIGAAKNLKDLEDVRLAYSDGEDEGREMSLEDFFGFVRMVKGE